MDRANAPLRGFIGITLLLSWGVAGAYIGCRLLYPTLQPLDGHSPVFALAAGAPSLAAAFVTWREKGVAGLRLLVGQVAKPFAWPWLFIAFAALPVAASAGWPLPLATSWQAIVAAPLLLINVPAWGEEFGWRGFALPRLLARSNVWTATLCLATIRIVWHLPAFLLGGLMTASMAQFGWWALSLLGLTCVMTVLYLKTNGNVLVAGILPHTLLNVMGATGIWRDAPAQAATLAMVGVAMLAVWGRPRAD